ncbi:VIP peptides-like isoform X1 [Phascolarctos cinereus]
MCVFFFLYNTSITKTKFLRYSKMEARSSSQLLVSLMLLNIFCSQTLALPLGTYSAMSNGMLFDGPSEPNQNPGLLKVENDHLESSLPENDLSFGDAPRALIRNRRQFEEELKNLLQDDVFRQLITNILHELNNKQNEPK